MTLPTSLSGWLNKILQLHATRIDLGLERIQTVAESLQVLQWSCPVITVAGTNGKGSCVALLESCYTAAGYRVGCYTSPELLSFNERIKLGQQSVSDEALVDAFKQIEQARGDLTLSFFEYTTLAALLVFQQSALDIMILEVGLGGRLDAVNIIDPTVAVITSIGIDHVDWLGCDRESIAREKAGIMRPNIPVVCGDARPPLAIQQYADEVGAELLSINEAFSVQRLEQGWAWRGQHQRYDNLPNITLRLDNAASSLMVLEVLQKRLPISHQQIITGLEQAFLPGRFEFAVINDTTVILDVAHNVAAAESLANQLAQAQSQGKIRAVFSAQKDKDIAGIIEPLLGIVSHWYVAPLDCERAASVDELIEALDQHGCCYQLYPDVMTAFDQARIQCDTTAGESLLAYGSFKTVAAVKQIEACLL